MKEHPNRRDRYWIAVTGHANIEAHLGFDLPNRGKAYNREAWKYVYRAILHWMVDLEMGRVRRESIGIISGMARGVDEIAARVAMSLELPLLLAIPGSVQWHQYRGPSRGIVAQAIGYQEILDYPGVDRVVEVGKTWRGGKYRFVNFARNAAMVDLATKVVSFQVHASAGTDDCIARARRVGKYGGDVYEEAKRAKIPMERVFGDARSTRAAHLTAQTRQHNGQS